MKKTIRICMLLLVMMLSFSLIAVCASAACEGSELVNIAGQGTVTGDRGYGTPIDVAEDGIGNPPAIGGEYLFWGVWDHYGSVIDGNVNTVCPAPTNHATPFGIRVTFDGPYTFEKVVIYPYGQGRVTTSPNIAYAINGRENGYQLLVSFISGDGNEIVNRTYTAEKDKIEIDTADFGAVSQIYVYIEEHKLAQGIWEIEAYTKETHNWVVQEVTLEPTCNREGTSTVKCSECGTTADAIVKPIGHIDNCTGECAMGCGTPITISHSKDPSKPCSSTCVKCNTYQASLAGSGHIADGSNPCSNTCVVCGENVVPDAYSIEKIWSTSVYKPYTYAKHVANPDDPCDTTCYSCGKANAVKAAHVPDPDNPCSVSQCKKCGESVFGSTAYGGGDNFPHYRAEGTCNRVCGKCNNDYKLAFAHEFVDEDGNPYCGGKCAHCGGSWMAEQPHTFTAQSSNVCVDCGWKRVADPCVHNYDNPCDNICNLCGAKRYGSRDGWLKAEYWHVYTNSCDTTCNDCNEERTITHTYSTPCQQRCDVCEELTRPEPTTPHTYSDVKKYGTQDVVSSSANTCDDACDVCLEIREVTHVFAFACAPICSKCWKPNTTPHTFDNDCDTDCNVELCPYTRKTEHQYDNNCDTTCNECGLKRTVADHPYDNACDTICNECGLERTVPDHVYDNACDTKCNVCDAERTVSAHVYDNACDKSCNVCGAERTVADHTYDNDCDKDCNVCGTTRDTSHQFGLWIEIKEATNKESGEETRFCNVCQYAETRTTDPTGGISTGAVAGIAVGGTAVVGGGGFCLWWFVFRKKFI